MFNRLRKFVLLPFEEKQLFFEASLMALISRLISIVIPFRKYSKYLGVPHKESVSFLLPEQYTIMYKVYRAVRRSSVYLPFREKCLIDAVVMKRMLLRKGIESTLYLGVAKEGRKQLIAHAWLRCGDNIVTGRAGMERFELLEWFT